MPMDYLYLALLAAVLLGLLYIVRSLRALHIKVGKQSDRLAAGIQKVTEQTRKSSLNDYRQLEAFVQLNSLLKFTAPIPATRGWAGSPDLLLTLAHVVKTFKPKLVVELGSGVSTVVMAKAGAKKVVSFDGSEDAIFLAHMAFKQKFAFQSLLLTRAAMVGMTRIHLGILRRLICL